MTTSNQTQPTLGDFLRSLTEDDEDLIFRHLHVDVVGGELRGTKFTRALTFLRLTREGQEPADARKQVRAMTIADLDGLWSPESDDEENDLDDVDPESPVGEGAGSA